MYFIIQLHRKYHHGEYQDLDNLKEENSEELNSPSNEDMDDMEGEGTSRPLLDMNKNDIDDNDDDDTISKQPILQLKHNI